MQKFLRTRLLSPALFLSRKGFSRTTETDAIDEKGVLRHNHLSPRHPRFHDSIRRSNGNRARRDVNLWPFVSRRNSSFPKTLWSRGFEYGKFRARDEWESIFRHVGANTVVGRTTYYFWKGEGGNESCSKDWIGSSRWCRSSCSTHYYQERNG